MVSENKTPAPVEHVLPIELNGVSAALEYGKGIWRTCTGCHESNEGYPTGPYSTVMKCHLGGGCFECGGIGAIWDMTDYEDMGRYLAQTGWEAEEKLTAEEAWTILCRMQSALEKIANDAGWSFGKPIDSACGEHYARIAEEMSSIAKGVLSLSPVSREEG